MGMEVKGYEATKADMERVEALKKEQFEKREQYKTRERTEHQRSRGTEKGIAEDTPKTKKPGPQKGKEGKDEDSSRSGGVVWAMASEIVKAVDARIKDVRSKGDGTPKEQLDDLYRQKHELKQLGDQHLMVIQGKDGAPEVADRKDLQRRARDAERNQERDLGIEIDR